MNVCVFGSANDEIGATYLDKGKALGTAIAEHGWGLVFGAGATGMMGAAARGAKEKGGYIIGVAPRFFDREGVLYQHCDEMIFTDTMRQRKQHMEDNSDAFVVTPGGMGTFEEFFEIITLKQLGQTQKPIVIFNIAGYYDPVFELLQRAKNEKFMSHPFTDFCTVATTVEQVINAIE